MFSLMGGNFSIHAMEGKASLWLSLFDCIKRKALGKSYNNFSNVDLELVNKLRGYIDESKWFAEELQISANKDNNLKQTCQVLLALCEVSEGLLEAGEFDIAKALAITSRYMIRAAGFGEESTQSAVDGAKSFNPDDLVMASMCLGASLALDNYRFKRLMFLTRSGHQVLCQKEIGKYCKTIGRVFDNAELVILMLQSDNLEEITEFGFDGLDIFINVGLLKLSGKIPGRLFYSLAKLRRLAESEKNTANAIGKCSCLEKPLEVMTIGLKTVIEFGPEVAKDVFALAKGSTYLLQQEGKSLAQTIRLFGQQALNKSKAL